MAIFPFAESTLMNTTTLLTEIQKLPVADRVVLVQQIWDQIAESDAVLHLTDAQKAEIDRRASELEANPDIAIPWQDVQQTLRNRSGQ